MICAYEVWPAIISSAAFFHAVFELNGNAVKQKRGDHRLIYLRPPRYKNNKGLLRLARYATFFAVNGNSVF